MDVSKILELPDESMRDVIIKELNLNKTALGKAIEDFKDWLKDEPDMPKCVDEWLIRSIITYSKYDLPLAKQRFKGYLQHRTKWEAYNTNTSLNNEYFEDLSLHRQVVIIPRYLPGGYRIAYGRFLPSVDQFDFQKFLKFL
ncbi:hypothetical protein Trydic_g14914, partial [Trypoxylus dichotomus]